MSQDKSPVSTGLSHNEEPIFALATAPTPSAIAAIRVSGVGCHEVLSPILRPKFKGKKEARKSYLYEILSRENGELIDEPVVVFYKGPNSYTGQDSIEIFCHGGSYIITSVFQAIKGIGIREAEPGEFTQRAFLNGKMDLVSAEGIKDLINASSHQQWVAARQLVTGKLSDKIESLRSGIIDASAYLEAHIDFPEEEDVGDTNLQEVYRRVSTVRNSIQGLLDTYKNGKVASQGLKVVLIGPPNAGKSTLLNTLLKKDRAIVTEIPGTTRDYLEESCLIRGRLIRLIDTAGVRESNEKVESIGIEASKRLAKEADLILVLADAMGADSERQKLEDLVQSISEEGIETIHLMTKADLANPGWGDKWLSISSHNGTGLSDLEKRITDKVDSFVGALEKDLFLSSVRHASALEEALLFIDKFEEAYNNSLSEECLAFELQCAVRAISGIIGSVDNEDILDRVFSDFCVGK